MAMTRYQRAYRNHFAAGGAIDLYNQGVIGANELKKSADTLKMIRRDMEFRKAAKIVKDEAKQAATAL